MALTATLNLSRAIINLVSDPTQYVACGTSGGGGSPGRVDTTSQEGEFRQYANANTRLIQGSGQTRVLENFTLRLLTPPQVRVVKSFTGKTVLFRDTYGRKVYGAFLVTSVSDVPLTGKAQTTLLTDVSIEIQEITYSEVV